jgi:hypothetical protein
MLKCMAVILDQVVIVGNVYMKPLNTSIYDDKVSKNYKLIIILSQDPLLCIISTNEDSTFLKFI